MNHVAEVEEADTVAWVTLDRPPVNALTMRLYAEIDAAEAYRVGFVQKVFPPDQLAATAIKMANTIARNTMLAHHRRVAS